MPNEYTLLKNHPVPLQTCPKCGETFKTFMRGQVMRNERWFWIGPRRDYCALICSACKEIVGWESPL